MGTIHKDSILKNVLKNLCCSYGWSYGVYWGFHQENPLLLNIQDAYYEEKIEGLIDALLLQVPMLGGGIIGQAAFTKKYLWMSSEDHYRGQNSSGSISDIFSVDSEFRPQYSTGIKTIAVIPVEPQGVVQFGSTEKILESTEFVNQTKRIFQETVNGGRPEIASSSNVQSRAPNGLFASLISSENSYVTGIGLNSVGPTSLACQPQSSSFSLKSPAMLLNNNQSTSQLQPNSPFFQVTGAVNDATATWSCNSTLTSIKEPLIAEPSALECWNSFPVQSNSPLPFTNSNQDSFGPLPDFGIPDEFFQTGDFNISQWFSPSPDQSNVTLGGPTLNDGLLSQAVGLPPINSDEKGKSLTIPGIDVDLLGNSGDWGDIIMPIMNEGHLGLHSYNSDCVSASKSTQNSGNQSSALGPKKGLFSKLGIEELLEGISGTSNAVSTSCIEDQVSSGAKRRKLGNSIWDMGSLQPVVYNNGLGPKKEAIPKSEPGLWMGDAYSMNASSTVSQAKKQVEPPKPAKKKAKPGTRPRPKDRQQILDRMAELRELIPNGEKMSIDCLLDRTIKHMLFLQSVTKHAERIKQADEPKRKYANDPSTNGVTWACELGNQTMICPLIVEDLSTPGQMLIEMICEEQGFFLEIVDIIRGFGLTILKGVMEVREEKIWARFIVEAEGNRRVTRHEIFSALVQLLQTTTPNDNQLDNKVMEGGNKLLNNFPQSGMQLPVSLADTRYCINL